MTVLSDISIRREIAGGRLIRDADPARAEHGSYEFAAGMVYFGGPSETLLRPVALTADTNTAVQIHPGCLVWVRSRETVVMPRDKIGVWIQTHSLSRKGLLLLNMSLVEPGYEGFLTAVFVNFGRSSVGLTASTKIAKLMFLELDHAARVQCGRIDPADYDANTLKTALAAPSTFIRFKDFLPDFEDARVAAVHSLKAAEQQALDNIEKQVRARTDAAVADVQESATTNLKSFLQKAFGGFLVGMTIFIAVVGYFFFTVFPHLTKYARNWDDIAEDSVKRALVNEMASRPIVAPPRRATADRDANSPGGGPRDHDAGQGD